MSASTPSKRERQASKALDEIRKICDKQEINGKAREAATTIDGLMQELEKDQARSEVVETGLTGSGTVESKFGHPLLRRNEG